MLEAMNSNFVKKITKLKFKSYSFQYCDGGFFPPP